MPITKLEDLKPDPRNANRGTPRGHSIIERSVRERGAGRSGLAAADGTMIAGSQTLQKMAELGMKIKPVHTSGDEWVVVIRDDIEPGSEEATLLALEDNRSSEVGLEWEPDVLSAIAREFDVSALFTADELREAAAPSLPEAGAGGDEFDPTPDDGPTRAQLGDLWSIGGAHRLIVGDCTDAAVVARLMGGGRADMAWFDPPFGIDLQPQRGLTDVIANDGNIEAREVWRGFLPLLYSVLHDNTVAFLCQGWSEFDWTLPLVREFFTIKSKVVWYKNNFGIGYYLRPQHEDALYCWKGTPPKPSEAISDVWEVARLNAPEHAAEKPVALMQTAIEFACKRGGLVVDWFAGVGGTLIAAHRTGRRCYGCEISPRYADVILRRAEAEGLTAELVPAG